MPGERQNTDVTSAPAEETSPTGTPLAGGRDAHSLLEMHRSIANRLLREGAPARAYSELVRATRAAPMNGRLASALANIALRAGAVASAITLLTQGVDEAEGADRSGVRRSLARLLRRHDDLEAAREQLTVLLAELPEDRRARAVLNALLEREERWDELDASLDKETRQAISKGALRRASRSALRRARLWSERLAHPARAALRYGQAAQLAEQGDDFESAFLLRLLWLRMLHKSNAPDRAISDAIETSIAAGQKVGKADRARQLISELGLGQRSRLTLTELEAQVEEVLPDTEPVGPPRRNSGQVELMKVAEEAEKHGRKPEVAAILRAAIEEGPDPAALRRLEAHFIARGAWRELAGFYRDASAKGPKSTRAGWLEKLAELLESELDDPMGAARAWAEVAALTGDPRAVQEQVRLHTGRKDPSSARKALDEAVTRAGEPRAKADALVARAEEALTRKDVAAARTDFEQALVLVGDHPNALAGLAELPGTDATDLIARLHSALELLPRRKPGRGELYRRLGRLVDARLKQPPLASKAWAEVLVELEQDEEAQARMAVLARAAGDSGQLEHVLRAQIEKEPRGTKTRKARLELVQLLEDADRRDEALDELRKAVRFEPGHQSAWLRLVEHLEERGLYQEGAWALEHATTATEDAAERASLWRRLSAFVSEHLGDAGRADTYLKRAEKMEREQHQAQLDEPSTNPLTPLVAPPKGTAAPQFDFTPTPGRGAEPGDDEKTPAPPPVGEEQDDFEEVAKLLGSIVEPDPGRRPEPVRRGGLPQEVLALLEELQAPAFEPELPSSENPWGADITEGRPVQVRPPSGAPTAAKTPPRAPPVARTPPAPPPRAESGRVAAVPRAPASPQRPVPPAVESSGQRVQVRPVPPPHESAGRGVAVRPPGAPKVETSGRGVAVHPAPPSPRPHPAPPRPVTSGRGVAVPRDIASTQPLQTTRAGLPSEPARTLSLPQVEPTPPGAQGPSFPPAAPPAAKGTSSSGSKGKYPQVPSLPMDPAKMPVNTFRRFEDEDEEEAFEGSLLDRLEEQYQDGESVEEAMSGEDDFVEVGTSDIELPQVEWEAPAGKLEEPRPTQELPAPGSVALGDPAQAVPPSFGPPPSAKLSKEREHLFERVRANPLDPDGYRRLAEHFDAASDPSRQSLMLELARALEGDPHAAPRTPKLILSATDRAGLRHPRLRGEEGELLALSGLALCRIYPTRGPAAGTKEEFRVDMGKGAKAAADALLAAVRILGLRAPDVYLSNDNGPPFALVFPGEVRLLVGRLAAKRELPEAELRFFAGRALFTQNPDLLALRTLRKEQLYRSLNVLGAVLRGQAMSAEARAVRDGLPPKGWERLKQLYERVGRTLDLGALSEGARHSANRAGLLVAGGVAPALSALRAKKALPSEMIELVRFAGSERYLNIRMRKLARS